MISITVRHHNPHLVATNLPSSTGSTPTGPSSPNSLSPAASSSSSSSSSALPSPSFTFGQNKNQNQNQNQNQLESSSVEVQYEARFFRQPTKGSDLRQGQLKQVQNRSTETTDLTDNMNSTLEKSSKEENSEASNDNNNNQTRPINLHSRSISLVISSNSEAAECALKRRRSMPRIPRRMRLRRLANEATLAGSVNSACLSQPESDSTQTNTQPGKPISNWAGGTQTEQTEEPSRLGKDSNELKSETSTATSTSTGIHSSDSFERLRQTGVSLREISDEFAKSRRRTI